MKIFYLIISILFSVPVSGMKPDRKIERKAIHFLREEIIIRA
jgi:hypothetical protein